MFFCFYMLSDWLCLGSEKGKPAYPSAGDAQQSGQATAPSAPPSYQQAMNHPIAAGNMSGNAQWSALPPGQVPYSVPVQGAYPAPGQVPYAVPVQGAYPVPGQVLYSAPGYSVPGQVPYPATNVVPNSGVVYAQGAFDAGARFSGVAPPRIPPPPPGVAPNAVQQAAAAGHTVVASQRRSNFWTDGAGGGCTFW